MGEGATVAEPDALNVLPAVTDDVCAGVGVPDGASVPVPVGEGATVAEPDALNVLPAVTDGVCAGEGAPVLLAVSIAVRDGVLATLALRVCVAVGDGSRYSLRTRGPSSSSTDSPSPVSAMCPGEMILALVAGPPSPIH